MSTPKEKTERLMGQLVEAQDAVALAAVKAADAARSLRVAQGVLANIRDDVAMRVRVGFGPSAEPPVGRPETAEQQAKSERAPEYSCPCCAALSEKPGQCADCLDTDERS